MVWCLDLQNDKWRNEQLFLLSEWNWQLTVQLGDRGISVSVFTHGIYALRKFGHIKGKWKRMV